MPRSSLVSFQEQRGIFKVAKNLVFQTDSETINQVVEDIKRFKGLKLKSVEFPMQRTLRVKHNIFSKKKFVFIIEPEFFLARKNLDGTLELNLSLLKQMLALKKQFLFIAFYGTMLEESDFRAALQLHRLHNLFKHHVSVKNCERVQDVQLKNLKLFQNIEEHRTLLLDFNLANVFFNQGKFLYYPRVKSRSFAQVQTFVSKVLENIAKQNFVVKGLEKNYEALINLVYE